MNPETFPLPSQKLKSATAAAHSHIEGSMQVMRDEFDLQQYKTLLGKLYGFYRPLEAVFTHQAQMQEWVPDYSAREKLNLLEADLRYFQVLDAELEGFSHKDLWFEDASKGRILGTLYVLEGSTLGGQLISKHLKQKFQFSESEGTRFFSAYGIQTGLMWKRFQAVLNEHLNEESILEESIQAANATFHHLGQWLRNHR